MPKKIVKAFSPWYNTVMENNAIFNATVCILGILILSIHTVNLIVKKGKRKDEKSLLDFFVFTIIHFTTYLVFALVKVAYTSNVYIIAFYTVFYIFNNVEVFMLYRYMSRYVELSVKTEKALSVLNLCLFSVFVALDIINTFTGIFFTAQNGVYLRSRAMILSQGYQFVMFVVIFLVTVLNKRLNAREKTAFALYCFLPLVAIILQNVFKGYAIAYASILVAIEVLFFFVNVQKNIELAKEEEKNKDAQIKIMLSQIQPHFVYNSLSSISTLIPLDPPKAQEALDDFTEYLRRNLSSLTAPKRIPFEDELNHIKTYVTLEKIRFGERINVVYDIQATDFAVPALSIQPIVENAVKHGILQRLKGGTVTLRTYSTDESYVVEVSDDGVGFRPDDVDFESNRHFGINNVKYRIEKAGNGTLTIESTEGKGTRVRVVFHKETL